MCGSCSGPYKSSECVETEKQCCPVCKGKHKAWDIGCENRKKELRRVRRARKQLLTYHQIHRSLSPAQARQSSANAESHQEMETEPTHTQEILPASSKPTEQCQRPNTASRESRGGKRIVAQSETPSRSQTTRGRTELTPSSFGRARYSLYDPFSRPALAKTGTQSSQQAIQQLNLRKNAEVDGEDKENKVPDAYEDASSSLTH